MREPALYEVLEETDDMLLICDVGTRGEHLTVTNDVERVVKELAPRLGSRRLEYYDSYNNRDQILVENGEFAGFMLIR